MLVSIAVFPAYAGMSPVTSRSSEARSSFPRLRGDEPPLCDDLHARHQFSPPTRG